MESFPIGSSSSSRPIHVYLSFKGDDETCRFTDMLWAALETDNLNTFWDDKKLESGDPSIFLPRHILKAIQQSNISIVVFSKTYPSSIWCLEELFEIAARVHEPRYIVIPIFYAIDPSEVQNQRNSFEKALTQHERRFTGHVRSWRLAMKQVASLSGYWHVPSDPCPQVIDDIVREVKKKVGKLGYVDADLVGMQSRVRQVEELLNLNSNDKIRALGICGMGGSGKSTLARVVYDKISHQFDASYFMLKQPQFDMSTIRMVHGKSILLVLDDLVIYQQNLESLIKTARLLGGGSRIVITTRDERVLEEFKKHDIDINIYRMKLLSRDEALQLFCRKAFRLCDFPVKDSDDDVEVINRAMEYADGLPLAIVKLGSFLYNTRSSEWSTALAEFKRVAQFTIMKVLKRSYFELDIYGREAFLDTACFFIGKEIKYVKEILDASEYGVTEILDASEYGVTEILDASEYDVTETLDASTCASPIRGVTLRTLHEVRREVQLSLGGVLDGFYFGKSKLQLLIQKSLVTIVEQKIQMHSLLQEMGRNIVQHWFPSEPEQWSRLWDFDDIYRVMQNDTTATLKVQALVLEVEDSERRTLRVEALSRMNYLRLLIFRNVKFSGVLEHLSPCLQYISWHQYPFTSLPSRFEPYRLKELILPDSCITRICDEEKVFNWLKNMNLNGSKDLTKMPKFKGFPSLERLELEGCTKLSHLDPSLTSLSGLKFLNLRNCSNIVSIPNDLFSLPSLEMLNLACCSKFAFCLNFCPFDIEERECTQQSFPSCKRQKLHRQKTI